MKKIYQKITTYFVLLCALSVPMGAQLSGLYTINSQQPTGSGNYQSFSAFATDLNTQGVNGPVTVNVITASGPYNEQPVFNNYAGASSANKVTINGNGNLLYFNATSGQPWILALNGADWMVFNELDIATTNPTYGYVCLLSNGSNNNYFSACTFSTPANTTSYQHIPVLTSSSLYYESGGANSANYNTWEGCRMVGGYYSIMLYGLYTAPFQQANDFIDCSIEDFYEYGMYQYYVWNSLVKGCRFWRPTRTNYNGWGVYGVLQYYAQGNVFDSNVFEKFFEMNKNSTDECYLFYAYNWSSPGYGVARNKFQNNIIRNMEFNGSFYGTYYTYDTDVLHNTYSLDHTASTSSGVTYVIYDISQATNPSTVRNNLISITRGGTGTKYGIYCNSPGSSTIDGNNIYVNSPGVNNFIGFYNGGHQTWAAWQTAGADPNGGNFNPQFANIATGDVLPTNNAMNNQAPPIGMLFDHKGDVRHATTPDFGALEFLTPICTGSGNQTVVGPSYEVCPGESAKFSIGNLSSDLGFTYQWRYSTISSVGLWTVVPGANSITYQSGPINATTWVSAIITCTAPGGGTMTPVTQVNVAAPTSSTVPYYEDFEGIGMPDRLPNCSWNSPNLGSGARTYTSSGTDNRHPRSGTNFAAFSNADPGTSHYFTNPIWMEPGITYSASLWYQSNMTGATNWSNLSILVGTSQNPAGLTQIASVAPAVAAFYKPLSNTFSVSAPGNYYVAIRATGASGAATYLSWDDLSIIIPCSLNSPTISLSANTNTVCAGQPVVLSATGADSYVWNNGSQTPVITVYPQKNTPYSVTGINNLSGCGTTLTQAITVNPSPGVIVVSNKTGVCPGQSAMLTAGGALSYIWSTGGSGPSISVSPASPTTYSVIGSNQHNCNSTAAISVSVHPTPNVSAQVDNNLICRGDAVIFTGSGAVSYLWLTHDRYNLFGNPITNIPTGDGTYTLTGTDANGCKGTAMVSIITEECVGVSEVVGTHDLKVFPNPSNGEFTVEMGTYDKKTIEVADVTGRVVHTGSTEGNTFNVNIRELAAGIYYVKVSSDFATDFIKVVKQ